MNKKPMMILILKIDFSKKNTCAFTLQTCKNYQSGKLLNLEKTTISSKLFLVLRVVL